MERRICSVIAFLDTEFTDLQSPKMLSLGMVALNGLEHYGELDLTSGEGQVRLKASSEFVRQVVLPMWGAMRYCAGTPWELGRRAGEFLLRLAGSCPLESRLTVAFDYDVDFFLLEDAIRDAGLWDQIRDRIEPLNIDRLTGTLTGELESEECFRSLARRGIGRHHALADALALRAAYLAVKASSVRRVRDGGRP